MFIAFEGIDGCGKSTQIKKFAKYLFDKDKHNHIVFTRNPYRDVRIREILRLDDNPNSQAEKLAELFIGDRIKHSEEVVKPALEKGMYVITDRFKLSTVTYQTAQGLNMIDLIKRHEGLPIPDITFIVDVSSNVAAHRMKNEGDRNEHKFEKNLDFLEKVRENFYKARDILSNEKIFIINGERLEDDIFDEIVSIFERELREKETEFG